MPKVQEGQLLFTFPKGSQPLRFDGKNHGLSHCMKAVDFVVEFTNFQLFVEVKDPDDTTATAERRAEFSKKIVEPCFTRSLSLKFRDSFLYRWAAQRLNKPVRYVVLLQLTGLRYADYLTLSQKLERELPTAGLPASWTCAPCAGVAVIDVATWNALGSYGNVTRVP